jgi:hypothetical protein
MADLRETAIRIGPTMELVAERRFYAGTFLIDDQGSKSSGHCSLFVTDAAIVRNPAGRETLRVRRDVLEFPDEASMLSAVVDGGWFEADEMEENPRWRPTAAMVLAEGSE